MDDFDDSEDVMVGWDCSHRHHWVWMKCGVEVKRSLSFSFVEFSETLTTKNGAQSTHKYVPGSRTQESSCPSRWLLL